MTPPLRQKEKSERTGLNLNIQKTKIMATSPITSWQKRKGKKKGKKWKKWQIFSFWAPKSLQIVTAAMKLKDICSWKESCYKPRQHIKKQSHYFVNKGPSSQSYDFFQ